MDLQQPIDPGLRELALFAGALSRQRAGSRSGSARMEYTEINQLNLKKIRMQKKQLHKVTKSALVRLIGLGSVVALREAGLVVVPGSKLKSLVDDLGWQIPENKKPVVVNGGGVSVGATATATADAQAQASLCLPSDQGGDPE